ncbi:MAG: nucleotidyltransferase domain-containing protein [Alicyclobacillus herbarius]|uniref:type VII toxin-antitoxin system MntA family adenylyltransferase antitoxin n=1 Tax=Alicyclobacillus herbarius TaxID=122960 RepID=UPI00235738E5|nr:nucleotidyltransferase domain-containing protein [Alicyclobacillus herbarius]MCL6632751.1 nucleotidyltransferase domain-containing protein [Alicyclobacillus herbarius]
MNTLSDTALQQIVTYLTDNVRPLLIYLFGSAARGQLRSDSDVDVAFLPQHPLHAYDTFLHAQALADVVKRDVDLVDLSRASTVMQAEVVARGQRLYEADRNERYGFEMRTLKAYTMLNEERQCILDRMQKRGSAF